MLREVLLTGFLTVLPSCPIHYGSGYLESNRKIISDYYDESDCPKQEESSIRFANGCEIDVLVNYCKTPETGDTGKITHETIRLIRNGKPEKHFYGLRIYEQGIIYYDINGDGKIDGTARSTEEVPYPIGIDPARKCEEL